jgi:hypothetical protein
MDRRGISVTFVALMLAVMMTSSTTATPGMGVMQTSPGSEDGQPDAENNTLYLFGNQQLSNCFSKFNNTDADSASYGEKNSGSGNLDIKATCRMEPTLNEDVMLKEGEMINTRFTLNLGGAWTNGADGCNTDCENLNISLLKGNRVVSIKEFDSLGDGENSIIWDIPVTEDLITWNGSQETLGVEFTMKLKAVQGGFLGVGGEDAIFGLYFSHAENTAERNASVTFPILNQTAVDELTDDGSMSGGEDAGLLPGFTAMVGIGGLAAAALLRGNEDEE